MEEFFLWREVILHQVSLMGWPKSLFKPNEPFWPTLYLNFKKQKPVVNYSYFNMQEF